MYCNFVDRSENNYFTKLSQKQKVERAYLREIEFSQIYFRYLALPSHNYSTIKCFNFKIVCDIILCSPLQQMRVYLSIHLFRFYKKMHLLLCNKRSSHKSRLQSEIIFLTQYIMNPILHTIFALALRFIVYVRRFWCLRRLHIAEVYV